MKLEGQVAVVTGAAQGIGAAIAEAFAAEGAVIAVSDVMDTGITVDRINAGGGRSVGIHCDVTSEEDVARLFREAEAQLGQVRLLVNNAGTNLSYDLISEMPTQVWEDTLRLNLTGTMFGMREGLRLMVPRGAGNIINISSNVGKRGLANRSAYAASKWAVIGLTRTGALEAAEHGIRVNAICPGAIQTELVEKDLVHHAEVEGRQPEEIRTQWLSEAPIHRMFAAAEIAPVAVFLASDDSATLTGQALNASGGLIMD